MASVKASSPKSNKGQKIVFSKKRKTKTQKPRNHGACARGKQHLFPRQKQKSK